MADEITPSVNASSETPAETTAQPEGQQQTTPKTYTQDEYDRYGQSQASKGKNDLLKSMGVNSVQEVLDMKTRMAEMEKSKADSEGKIAELTKQTEEAQNVARLTKLGIAEEHFEDVMILARAKQGSDTLADAVEKVAKSNPQWLAHKAFGSPQAPQTGQAEGVPADLKKKYPYLH